MGVEGHLVFRTQLAGRQVGYMEAGADRPKRLGVIGYIEEVEVCTKKQLRP